ncbi:MAG: aminoacyl-tRNA hydrolase [Bacillota bacterium]|jgi:PTH1 family peptidyl-tRNA hydrolase|nr:aminoacyl-tRNA hydrolase [Bacillota bacterium]HHU43422.1 aminoacyl-tRNA hydrolase [Clostridiales bacterium]
MRFNLKRFFQREKKETLIIVGLGNPGDKYQDTFHNMGYKVIEALEQKTGVKCKKAMCSSLVGEFNKDGMRIILAKPVTYMNLSGQAVKSLLARYEADLDDLIVVYDDIDLPRYQIRARKNGGSGTHNGMKNIVEMVSSGDFMRIRIGIGREGSDLKDYVLTKIPKSDMPFFQTSFEKTADEILSYIEHKDFEKTMRNLNTN